MFGPKVLSFVAGLAVFSLSHALRAEPSAAPQRTEFRLKNGLRTILFRDDAHADVSVVVGYAVDSAHDPPSLEHAVLRWRLVSV